MSELGPIDAARLTGNETFHSAGQNLGFNILDFWQWNLSDLISNTTRGVLAEFLVAQAIGAAKNSVREEWAAYDLTAPDGTRIEVKSSAYIQSWHQNRLSEIVFNVPKTKAWDPQTNRYEKESHRQADVYVFALLAHTDQKTIDPLDTAQWRFHVLPTAILDNRKRSQHSITLRSLEQLAVHKLSFAELHEAIKQAAKQQIELLTQNFSGADPDHAESPRDAH